MAIGLRSRLRAFALLLLAVVLAHVLVGTWVADAAAGWREGRASQGPQRLKAVFVAELRPTAAPVVAPGVEPAPPTQRAALTRPPLAAEAASAPAAAEPPIVTSAAEPVVEPARETLPAPPSAAVSEPDPPTAPVAQAASAPPPFEWPRSTRLSYQLTGYYRGAVSGRASVEWLLVGNRYQVHLSIAF